MTPQLPQFVIDKINDIIKVEGDYVNNPADSGGPTRFGITEKVARAYGYTGDMRSLPKELAFEIYADRYWLQPRFNMVYDVAPKIAAELLDTGVNCGPATATKFLQRLLNVFNRQQKLYSDLVADGAIGKMTIAALNGFISARKTEGLDVLFVALNGLQSWYYVDIAERREKDEEFVYGQILNRVVRDVDSRGSN